MASRESLGTDPDYLRDHQYKDPTHLNARIALHTKYAQSDEPWYPWLVSRFEWPPEACVLEVGCGSGALWVNVAAVVPNLRLTLTDLSPGMLDAARAAVDPVPTIELVEARTCDAQALPFEDAAFDVVVANHMLYHLLEPRRAATGFARVLRDRGVLLAATNGPRHLDAVRDLTRQAFGWSSIDRAVERFGPGNGAEILGGAFADVVWHPHPSTLVCTDPEDVYAFIASSPVAHAATPEQHASLRRLIEARFDAEGGSLTVTTEAGCFVAREPLRS